MRFIDDHPRAAPSGLLAHRVAARVGTQKHTPGIRLAVVQSEHRALLVERALVAQIRLGNKGIGFRYQAFVQVVLDAGLGPNLLAAQRFPLQVRIAQVVFAR